ncbi:type II secretion system GspH family protein [Methylobacillus gramineus]|uniref:type II secretion system protein n=1 Tax=Methylobacillus gramineus TaxID=755169 RepID=UPI001D0017D3|nr:prepilin-type N-terminal cleavage/methylation domain-containing protein [Methylobacillus gramineus]MCB5183827.1 type II secretion system GspH family protein [Methylobacillus gramineus]
MHSLRKGFTLIEVLVVMAIVATLLSLVTPRYFQSIDRARETSLKHDLIVMRDAIDKFYSDTGTYPDTLYDLVERKYLRAIPEDPLTETSESWIVIPPEDPQVKGLVYDIRSGSEEVAADGSYYAEW